MHVYFHWVQHTILYITSSKIMLISTSIYLNLYSILLMVGSYGINEDLTETFSRGKANEISVFFRSHIDLTILEDGSLLTKLEAERKLFDFFFSHEPKSFKVTHEGNSMAGVKYIIGELVTNNGDFLVSFYISTNPNSEFVQQLIIDFK